MQLPPASTTPPRSSADGAHPYPAPSTINPKHRITGAVVLVVVAVAVIPMILGDDVSHTTPVPLTTTPLFVPPTVVEVKPEAVVAEPVPVPPPTIQVAEDEVFEIADGRVRGCVVQLGSFIRSKHALSRREQVQRYGYKVQVNKVRIGGRTYYRTWTGPMASRAEARKVIADLKVVIGDKDYSTPGC